MPVTSEASRSIETRRSGPNKIERRPVVLTPRDRELFVHLAVARCLSAEQIRRLLFAGASGSVVRRRLGLLAGGQYQYLRRQKYLTSGDGPAIAWSLKPLGYLAARNRFCTVPKLPGHAPPEAEFLEQVVRLNDLYVALAPAATRGKLRLQRWPFRWLASDSVQLPWSESDSKSNSPAHRLICPDATLELLDQKRRIFIEVENGLHALALLRKGSPGRNALKMKIDRYTRFVLTPVSNLSNDTFYLKAFPDRWPVELLFVVPSPSVRDAVAEYVARTWRPTNEAVQLTIRALTLTEAPAELGRLAQLPVDPHPESQASDGSAYLTRDENRAVYDFYNGAIAAIASVRQFVKRTPDLASSFPLPEYPANHHVMKQICLRLARTLESK